MKKINILILLMLLLATGAVWSATTLLVPAEYATVQAAIDAAVSGDTIELAAGVYHPTATINVNKSVTIQGPQAFIDPRPSAGSSRTATDASTEAIVEGQNSLSRIFYIAAPDVELNGLVVKSGTGDMIRQSSSYANTKIRYCIVHDGNGDEGIQLKHCTNGIVEYCYVYDIGWAGDGINFSEGSSNCGVRYNELVAINSDNAAIYVYDSDNISVENNRIYNLINGEGIKMGDKNGGDAARSGGTVRNNRISDVGGANNDDCIAIYMSGITVEGNDCYCCTSENGAVYLAYSIANITIRHNHIYDNVLKTHKYADAAGLTIHPSVQVGSLVVEENNFENNTPKNLYNMSAITLDATNNYWGDSLNPAATVSGPVNICPWLDAAYPNGTPAGPCVPCIADFSASMTQATGQLCVQFINISQNATEFLWDFGDGNTSMLENPEHCYVNPTSYSVTLTAMNPWGGQSSCTLEAFIQILPPPVADFDVSSRTIVSGDCVDFFNLSQNAVAWRWDFGDGTISTEENPQHCYAPGTGTFTVSLRAYNALGDSTEITKDEFIQQYPAGKAGFNAYPIAGRPGTEVQFFNNCGELQPFFVWNYGDGTREGFRHSTKPDEKVHPQHVYPDEGRYTVSLIARCPDGQCDTTVTRDLICIDPKFQPLEFVQGSETHADYGWEHAIDHDVISTNCKVLAKNENAAGEFMFADSVKKVVESVRIMANSYNNDNFGGHLAYDFEIAVSMNGIDYETAFAGQLKERFDWAEYEFEPVMAKYVKLLLKTARAENSPWITISEFQVFGTESNDISLGKGRLTDGPMNEFQLLPNYPNPFNPSTTIVFSLPESEWTTVSIYDINGREVATLVDNSLAAGMHTVSFNAAEYVSGVYFVKMTAGAFRQVRRIMYLK